MLGKCLTLFVIVVVLQANNAHSANQVNSALLKVTSKLLPNLHRKLQESFQSAHSDRREPCTSSEGKGGERSLVGFSFPDLDIPACIEATRQLADTEEILYEVYVLGKSLVSSALDLAEGVLACRNESSSVFTDLECVIVELEGSGSLWETALGDLYDLIASLKTVTLVSELKLCLGFNSLTCLTC